MQGAKHAIKVTPAGDGWTWELIDSDGTTTAIGLAPHQEGAMESAWRAARAFDAEPSKQFPEIYVGGVPPGRASRANALAF